MKEFNCHTWYEHKLGLVCEKQPEDVWFNHMIYRWKNIHNGKQITFAIE